MITLNYVIYDCIANICMLFFAVLAYRKIRYAWLAVLINLIIKVSIYGKYGIFMSITYLSAQLFAVLLATLVWLKSPEYVKPVKKRFIHSLIFALILVIVWVAAMYKNINPAILNYEVLFGFDYLCYILLVIGATLVVFRNVIGLLPIAVVLISYAVNYANSVLTIQGAPDYIKDFIPYYWVSAVVLFVAGIVLVASYTKEKRSI